MSVDYKICKNCGERYEIDTNDSDDGYCRFECWEEDNCEAPQQPSDVLNTDIKELIEETQGQ